MILCHDKDRSLDEILRLVILVDGKRSLQKRTKLGGAQSLGEIGRSNGLGKVRGHHRGTSFGLCGDKES